MVEIHLDGTRMEKEAGATLGELIPEKKPECCVAIIRPSQAEAAETRSIKFYTTAGEVVVELSESAITLLDEGVFDILFTSEPGAECFNLGWSDRYAAAFGPCTTSIKPAKQTHRYSKDDVILGCGGYDPRRSFIIFSKMNHTADHGAEKEGGVIGRVVSGRSVLSRWSPNDVIKKVERVISWADQSVSFTTTDSEMVLEEGMHIISHVRVVAEGYFPDTIETDAATSVEHLFLAISDGMFHVGRASSTHIRDEKMILSDVPQEIQKPRLEGTVTARTQGPSRGCIYIYTQDTPGTPTHTVIGRVEHGIELVKLAKEHDIFCITVLPERIDMLGLTVGEARDIAGNMGIRVKIDTKSKEHIIIGQDPTTTLEVLSTGEARLSTRPPQDVIGIRLDDSNAPGTCALFREITGLKRHKIGIMPLFFNFEDVFLFKPAIKAGTKINLENIPEGEIPPNTLAMTNDSRKGAGLIGVRLSANKEFGPTSEPFEGTNIIGAVLEPEKLNHYKEGDLVFIMEVH